MNKDDIELASDHVEEMAAKGATKNEVGYQEYLDSLDIEFSPKEERIVRWKLDVCQTLAPMTALMLMVNS